MIVYQLTADKPASCSGHVWMTDAHGADITLENNRFRSVGKMPSDFEYEAQLQALHHGGELKRAKPEDPYHMPMGMPALSFDKCDSLTLVLSAGTNFLRDFSKQWLGELPHAAVTKRVAAAAGRSVAKLMAEHVSDYQSLFRRFSLTLGSPASGLGMVDRGLVSAGKFGKRGEWRGRGAGGLGSGSSD